MSKTRRKEMMDERAAIHTWVASTGNPEYEYCGKCLCIKNSEPPAICDREDYFAKRWPKKGKK